MTQSPWYLLRLLLIALPVALNFCCTNIYAQDTLSITIQEAEKTFLANNFSLLAAKYNIDANHALIRQAKLWDNPVLSTDQNIYDQQGGFLAHNSNSGQVYIQVLQLIKTVGKRNKLAQLAEDNTTISSEQFDDLLRTLRYVLINDLFEIDHQLKLKRVYDSEINQLQRLVTGMDAQLSAGNVSVKDNMRVKALLFSLQNELVTIEANIIPVESELKLLLKNNDSVFIKPKLNYYLPDVIKTELPLRQQLIDSALQNRPDAKIAKSQLDFQLHNLTYQKALAMPDIRYSPQFMSPQHIHVIGAGKMGGDIAAWCALQGLSVTLQDLKPEYIAPAIKRAHALYTEKLKEPRLVQQAMDRLIPDPAGLGVKTADIIIEAIFENLKVKQDLFKDLEAKAKPECILATNTSSIPLDEINVVMPDPSRLVGIHFFNPAPIMPLVEIIPAITTDEKITNEAKAIIDSWGKVTVLTKDTPGFIVNRVARSYYGESIRIYEEGMADFATIDWAMKTYGGFKMGPFELMDFIGNDINYKVTESVWTQFFFEPRFKPSLTQKRLYEAKLFGRKSGRGYYNYAEGAVIPEPNKNEELGKYIFNRVISMLINEAVDSYYLKLASKEDLDLAMTKGVNYPKGLLRWADEIGLKNVYTSLDVLYELYNEDRYRPSILLKMMVRDEKKFY